MITISEKANPNYLAKVVELKNLRKHDNADRLQCVNVDFQNVITGLDAKEGDVYVYFPVESALNQEFLAHTNSFREKELNQNPEKTGFFEKNCRVKAMRLRGEKSMGYVVPITQVMDWGGDFEVTIGQEFDTINGLQICKKYVVKSNKKESRAKQGKKPKVSRLIEGQVHLHVDTENLRKNAHKISPDDIISVTYKTHGTSWWVANVINKKKLTWYQRLGQKLGFNVQATEYDLIYGSRRVVKNEALDDAKQKDHYYGYDLWEDIKNEVGEFIPKGFTLYGECLGFDKNGGAIQKGYDYGCEGNEHKLEIYRITHTNEDGLVTELTYPQIAEFCKNAGLNAPHLFFYGKAGDMYDIPTDDHWNENFVEKLQDDFNEGDCFMCMNKVPEEGIVVRKESLYSCDSYKLKSFAFLNMESKNNDKGIVSIEDTN